MILCIVASFRDRIFIIRRFIIRPWFGYDFLLLFFFCRLPTVHFLLHSRCPLAFYSHSHLLDLLTYFILVQFLFYPSPNTFRFFTSSLNLLALTPLAGFLSVARAHAHPSACMCV